MEGLRTKLFFFYGKYFAFTVVRVLKARTAAAADWRTTRGVLTAV